MSRILNLQGLAFSVAPSDGDSTSSAACCPCSTSSACSCFMGDDLVAV